MIANARKAKSTRNATRQRAGDANHNNVIRYAVVGLGYIAQAAVLPAFANAKRNCKLAAFVSDDPTKLKKLGRKYNVDLLYSYDQYDELLHSGEIDAVYIALPNSMHAEYTIRAARAGIHVLCEKPMAVTEDECLQMIAACRENNVKLMIAYRLHFEEANLKAVELANSGKLGDVRMFSSVFCFDVKDENIRLERELGGGTLYDIGIYCINAARYIFRAEPIEVMAFTESRAGDERFTETEEIVSVTMRFPEQRLATFMTSFSTSAQGYYHVLGTKGDLCVDMAYDYAYPIEHYLTVKGKTTHKKFKKRDQFAPELIHFSDCVLNDREPEPSGEEGLIDVRIIEALYRSANSGLPMRLNIFPPDERPSPRLEMKKRAVREPKLVHAEEPTKGE
jgi:predicted dehydrogenase